MTAKKTIPENRRRYFYLRRSAISNGATLKGDHLLAGVDHTHFYYGVAFDDKGRPTHLRCNQGAVPSPDIISDAETIDCNVVEVEKSPSGFGWVLKENAIRSA